MTQKPNSFQALDTLKVADRSYSYFRLDAVEKAGLTKLARLPYSLKILLENLLRFDLHVVPNRPIVTGKTEMNNRYGNAIRVLAIRIYRHPVFRPGKHFREAIPPQHGGLQVPYLLFKAACETFHVVAVIRKHK